MPDLDQPLASVTPLPPLVRPDSPIAVVVLHDHEWWPGFADAWRGERVSVRFTTAPGMTYVQWVPADRVQRVTQFEQDTGSSTS